MNLNSTTINKLILPTRIFLLAASLVVVLSNIGFSQSYPTDSIAIHKLYNQAKLNWYINKDSARYYLIVMEESAQRLNYQRGVAYARYGRGIIEPALHEQFQYYTQSLETFETLGDKFGVSLNLVKIGYIYQQIGQLEKAVEYYRNALAVKKQLDDFGGIALALIEIGSYYSTKGQTEEALKYFEESLVYRLKMGNIQGIAYSQLNMAEALFQLDRTKESLAMADSAISNFSKTQDLSAQVRSLYLRGQLLKKLNHSAEADKMFQLITTYAPNPQYLYFIMNAKWELSRSYESKGDIKNAFRLQSQYLALHDSLTRYDYRVETQRLVNQFEFDKSERQRAQELQLQQEHVSRRNTLEYLSISIIVLVIFAILFSGRKRLSNAVANGVLLIGLLLLFEFLLVLTDSTIERITGGDPAFKLIANLILALLILPGHQFLERYIHGKFLRQPDAVPE